MEKETEVKMDKMDNKSIGMCEIENDVISYVNIKYRALVSCMNRLYFCIFKPTKCYDYI